MPSLMRFSGFANNLAISSLSQETLPRCHSFSPFDVYEFTADALAAWLRKIPCKYAQTVVNLLKKEGALEYVSDK